MIKQLREQRMSWVDLPTGKSVRIIRPTEVEIATLLFVDGRVEIGFEMMCRFVKDWRGFLESDILGAGVGGSDPVVFSEKLWAEVSTDHADWVRTVANAILEAAVTHQSKKELLEKNS